MELNQKAVNSIWNTVEADAWSRNFDYNEYTNMCLGIKYSPVTEYAYKLIYKALQTIMDNDPQMQPLDNNMSIINQEF